MAETRQQRIWREGYEAYAAGNVGISPYNRLADQQAWTDGWLAARNRQEHEE